mmetsp:Transcript_45920/g.121421  ORF Transcript_45920/g.121421 Transcript_45920/m.121421 type:complete len:216 (-) Transcript_45920:144-791(-)
MTPLVMTRPPGQPRARSHFGAAGGEPVQLARPSRRKEPSWSCAPGLWEGSCRDVDPGHLLQYGGMPPQASWSQGRTSQGRSQADSCCSTSGREGSCPGSASRKLRGAEPLAPWPRSLGASGAGVDLAEDADHRHLTLSCAVLWALACGGSGAGRPRLTLWELAAGRRRPSVPSVACGSSQEQRNSWSGRALADPRCLRWAGGGHPGRGNGRLPEE